jgi:signal transduction histidine kinase
MTLPPPSSRWSHLAGNFAFFATAIAAYASTLASGAGPLLGPSGPLLLVLGLGYLAVGLAGLTRIHTGSPVWHGLLYFAAQLSLTTAILYLSRLDGFISLLLLPLASNALEMLPRRWAALICALLVVDFGLVGYALGGPATAIGGSLVIASGVIFVAAFTQVALRERNTRKEVERLAAELSAANQQLRAYAMQAEELATTQERNRLAREIHDTLGHYLTVINVQLEAAQAVLETDRPRALEAVRKAQTLTQEGLRDVRRSVAALRAAPTAGQPLPQALEELAEACRAAGILTELVVAGQPRPLKAPTELALYRAAQEALTNTRKHAHASRVDVRLDYGPGPDTGPVRLTVQDNGVGAVSGAPEAAGGFGLLGLRERLQLIGGQVRLATTPGAGFRLEVEAPG